SILRSFRCCMSSSRASAAVLALSVCTVVATAQAPPAPIARITFADAVRRAQEKNPTVAGAAAGILRAEGLVRQARAATLFQLSGNLTTTTLNEAVEFAGQTVTPRNALTASLTAGMPILAAAAWARRAQAQDTRSVAIRADGPADAIDEPDFAVPPAEEDPRPDAQPYRADLRLFAEQRQAAERVLRDSAKDWWPTIDALFQPSTVYPPQLFLPQN